jgi:hypothetical protein
VSVPLDVRPALGADNVGHHEVDLGAGCASDDADVYRHAVPRLAQQLAEIDRILDRAPGPVRYRPLRRAIWRALLLPAGFVLWTFRRQLDAGRLAGKPAENHDALQAMAYTLVARAILGDMRASALLADLIEGRVGRPKRRRSDARSSRDAQATRNTAADLDPAERARIIAELQAVLGKASSR